MFDVEIPQPGLKIFKALQSESRLINTCHKGVTQTFQQSGDVMVRKLKQAILEPPKTGRVYKLSGEVAARAGKVYHQASAPGEAPANMTGDLMRGSHFEARHTDLEFGYSSDQPYGKWMEEGTPGGKIKPRPVIQKIANKDGNKIIEKNFDVYMKRTIEQWLS